MAQTAEAGRLTIDQSAHLLRNQRRRGALVVRAELGPLSTREIADRVAARQYGRAVDGPRDYDKRSAVYISLYQNHLPALNEAGAIGEADSSEDMWHLTERGRTLCRAIESLQSVIGGEPA